MHIEIWLVLSALLVLVFSCDDADYPGSLNVYLASFQT